MELKTRFSAGRKLLFEVAIDLAFMANRPIQDYLNDLL
jgi:hypothetical protein